MATEHSQVTVLTPCSHVAQNLNSLRGRAGVVQGCSVPLLTLSRALGLQGVWV